jgi:hypothetical protein
MAFGPEGGHAGDTRTVYEFARSANNSSQQVMLLARKAGSVWTIDRPLPS